MSHLATTRLGAISRAFENKKSKRFRIVLLIAPLLVYGLSSAVARAQTLDEGELEQEGLAGRSATGDWNVTLGAGAALHPTYPGASTYHVKPIPLFSITYRDLIFLGPAGLGMNIINYNGFRAGPILGYEGGRNQGDSTQLYGLGNIEPNVTGGIFAAYRFGPFEIAGTARQALTHTDNGLNGLLKFDYHTSIIRHKLDLVIGPHLEFADGKYDQTWFGVTPDQSVQSALPIFAPGGGVKDVGLHASLTYHYSTHILLHTFASVKELTGDVANSPIVQNETQTLVGVGAAYHF